MFGPLRVLALGAPLVLALGHAATCADTASGQVPPAGALPPPNPAVMARLARIQSTLRATRYNHSTRVDEARGRYEFDCSGMVGWVLARSSPAAWATLTRRAHRPVARDFYRQFTATPPGRVAGGWARVARVADARPGDVVAWLKIFDWDPNTGHVVVVVEPPERLAFPPDAWSVRVADSTSFPHSHDTRSLGGGAGGFGLGTMVLVEDPRTGAPRALGWWSSLPFVTAAPPLAIGRPVR